MDKTLYPRLASRIPFASQAHILLCTDRVGYGHIRGMLAVDDALQRIGLLTKSVFASQASSPLYRWGWQVLDYSLGIPYKFFPEHYSRIRNTASMRGMQFVNRWMKRLDAGSFAQYARRQGHTIVVASHVTASHLLQRSDIRVYLLGLDPYAPLYWNDATNVITTAVDLKTQNDLHALGTKESRVTGPMVPLLVHDARQKLSKRIQALRDGKPLRVAIATGGSLTHGSEISALTEALVQRTTPQEVERVSVIVGDSVSMKESVTKSGQGDARLSVVYNPDPVGLVRLADQAIAEADVIFAKTGELAFCVSGGKAFKTFHVNPSLGPQELAIKDYVISTSLGDAQPALEHGLPPVEEIHRLLKQRSDGSLMAMMTAGLRVPADGALKVARMIHSEISRITTDIVN